MSYKSEMSSPEYGFDAVEASVDANKVYIRVRYHSPQEDYISLFLQGDTPGLNEFVVSGTKKGDNRIILSFDKDELRSFQAGLAVNIGSRNILFINKAVTDNLCKSK